MKGTYRGAKTHEGNRVSYPSYIHGPLHTGKNSKSYEKLPRLSNRVVSLIHTWAPPYREELKKSYEGYHAYRIPCVNHWQEEHLKVKPVPSDYHKSLVLYRDGKNSNVINVIRINVL